MLFEAIRDALAGGPMAVLTNLLDIAILWYLAYQLIRAIRGTRAMPILFGLGIVTGGYYLAGTLGLETLHTVIGMAAPYSAVAAIILFQTEIRQMLRDMALQFIPGGRTGKKRYYEYEDVVFALSQLSASKVGALIVLERETGLKTFVQSGVALEAKLSSDLLVSIFQRSSPLHDGGVIIERERIAAAACFLPLTTNPGLMSTLGTRHRAAIGITEESDALALVVSETDGKISVAANGKIDRGISLDRLRLEMIQRLGPVVSAPSGAPPPDKSITEPAWPPTETAETMRESRASASSGS